MFDVRNVQNSPAWPKYSEHSFVISRSPLRGDAATIGTTEAMARIAATALRTIFLVRIICSFRDGVFSLGVTGMRLGLAGASAR